MDTSNALFTWNGGDNWFCIWREQQKNFSLCTPEAWLIVNGTLVGKSLGSLKESNKCNGLQNIVFILWSKVIVFFFDRLQDMLFLAVLFSSMPFIVNGIPLKVDNTWSLMPFNVDEQLGEEVHLMPENMDSILDQVLNISQKGCNHCINKWCK